MRKFLPTRARDRGAALPEYALGLGLVVLASLAAINSLGDASTNELAEREAVTGAGTELTGEGFTYGGASGGGSSSGGTDGGTPAATVVDLVMLKGQKGTKQTKDSWIANVTVDLSSNGDAVENATVTVSFVYGSTTSSTTCPLPSDKKGEAECELASIPGDVTSVTATVDSVSGADITYTPPSPKVSTTISRPQNVS